MKAVFNSSPIIFLTKLGVIEGATDLLTGLSVEIFQLQENRWMPAHTDKPIAFISRHRFRRRLCFLRHRESKAV
mgnify:CR=1 FL=1|jgi:hypothetical protein